MTEKTPTIEKASAYIKKAREVEDKYGIPAYTLVGLLATESGFNKNAKSKYAVGIAQFKPETAKEYGIDPYNTDQAIDAAGKYLSSSYQTFGNWEDSLRSYNMGVQGVKDWKAGNRDLPQETAEYTGKVWQHAKTYGGVDYGTTAQGQNPADFKFNFNYNYNSPTNDVRDLSEDEKSGSFAQTPQLTEQELAFVKDYIKAQSQPKQEEYPTFGEEQQTAEVEPQQEYQQPPSLDIEELYNSVSEFIDAPVAQMGGLFKNVTRYREGGVYDGVPLEGELLQQTIDAQYQQGGTYDKYGNKITANISIKDIPRSYYDPRFNEINLSKEEGNNEGVIAHEGFHEYQRNSGRMNFGVHNGDFMGRIQKLPSTVATDEDMQRVYDRKRKEVAYEYKKIREGVDDFKFIPEQITYDKYLDPMMYDKPSSLEGEAYRYEKTGEEPFQQGGEVEQEADRKWLEDWYRNRKIPNQDIQNLYEEDRDLYLDKLLGTTPKVKTVESIDGNPDITGRINYETNEIHITPNAQNTTYLHELNHYANDFPSAMRTVHNNVVEQNMYKKGDPRLGVNNANYDYFRNPDEMHSRLMILRKDAGFKPDEDVSKEKLTDYLKNYKGDNQNILELMNLTDDNGLLEMLNFMAENKKTNSDLRVAQQGGKKEFTENELAYLSEIKGNIPVSSRGMYDYPNQDVIVPTKDGRITMKNINYPIKGTDEYGNTQIMYPNGEYQFKGKTIHEKPLQKQYAQAGLRDERFDSLQVRESIPDLKPKILSKKEDFIPNIDELKILYPNLKTNEGMYFGKGEDVTYVSPDGQLQEVAVRSNPKKHTVSEKEKKFLEEIKKYKNNDEMYQSVVEKNTIADKQYIKLPETGRLKKSNDILDVITNKPKTINKEIEINSLKNADDVKEIQKFLIKEGFNINPNGNFKDGGVDGSLGRVTKEAISKYNQKIMPNSVKEQVEYIKNNPEQQNYAILNKRNNTMYYYDKNNNLIEKEPVITGQNNTDRDYSISMRDWFEMPENKGKSHEDYFNYLGKYESRVTPSGHFTIASLNNNILENPASWKTENIFNPFKDLISPTYDEKGNKISRNDKIKESRERDYGLQNKLFTLKDDNGVYSSKAIHGTNNPKRIPTFESPKSTDRDQSNGCINVNGESKCFDLLTKNSSIYILPELDDKVVEKDKKFVNNGNMIKKAKSKVYNKLKEAGIENIDEKALNFITSVYGKESSFGTNKLIPIQDKIPLFKSDGDFQINPNTFKDYLPENYKGTFKDQVQAVYNFYKKNKDKYTDYELPEENMLYDLYNSGSTKKVDKSLMATFSAIHKRVKKIK